MVRASCSGILILFLIASLVIGPLSGLVTPPPAAAIGLVAPVTHLGIRTRRVPNIKRNQQRQPSVGSIGKSSKIRRPARARRAARRAPARPKVPVPLPQQLVRSLNVRTIAPGVVHKSYRGQLSINLIDIDMVNANVEVRPVLAGESFPGLADVKNQIGGMRALAAINANYFKKDGTPLGTLIIDKEWVAGPLFDRVSLGITRSGYVRVDRVNLHGTLSTNNPDVGRVWVNNINQPRRTGSRLIAYTRRWNSFVRLPYEGCLVAVNAHGMVVATADTAITIPEGGFVLSDRKAGAIAKLRTGDQARLTWHTRPSGWSDVVHAVSGGPMLMKDGKLFVNLKGEKFRPGWTGSHIKARTAAGVTWNNHLLLLTIEGPHTLWDLAKFLQRLDCADAMNLDGGGSTTMVVAGRTVTRNASSYQRRVANSLAVVAAGRQASGGQSLSTDRPMRPPEFYLVGGGSESQPLATGIGHLVPSASAQSNNSIGVGLPPHTTTQPVPISAETAESPVDTPTSPAGLPPHTTSPSVPTAPETAESVVDTP